jgi:hypothetical protein
MAVNVSKFFDLALNLDFFIRPSSIIYSHLELDKKHQFVEDFSGTVLQQSVNLVKLLRHFCAYLAGGQVGRSFHN